MIYELVGGPHDGSLVMQFSTPVADEVKLISYCGCEESVVDGVSFVNHRYRNAFYRPRPGGLYLDFARYAEVGV